MDLEGVTLSEISQTENQYYMISLVCDIKKNNKTQNKNKLIDTEDRLMVARGRGI